MPHFVGHYQIITSLIPLVFTTTSDIWTQKKEKFPKINQSCFDFSRFQELSGVFVNQIKFQGGEKSEK